MEVPLERQQKDSLSRISECFIKPNYTPEEANRPYYLGPWDLCLLSGHYIQKGLLFVKPQEAYHQENEFVKSLLEQLKDSLSLTLVHFYPLAGRLATRKDENQNKCRVFVDCHNSPGARFIHATLDVTVSDILSPVYVPKVVQSFFDHHKAVNHDGHTRPLLSVQVTDLADGTFIGVSMNHCLGDGTSFWNFFNSWSEIFQAQGNNNIGICISRPPIHERWFPDGEVGLIDLPFAHPDEFISRYESPELKERFFHFSAESVARLKAKANADCNTNKISTFQALSALIWRCITRARRLLSEQATCCKMAANSRSRLEPPISQNYFGNSISLVRATATVGELLGRDLGWGALKLHQAVASLTSKEIHSWVNEWIKSPCIYHLDHLIDPTGVMMGSSPRFNKYGNEFGMGKAVAIRSGYSLKFDGKVSGYPGREGGGSVDLEVCLLPEFMEAFELDEELMSFAS